MGPGFSFLKPVFRFYYEEGHSQVQEQPMGGSALSGLTLRPNLHAPFRYAAGNARFGHQSTSACRAMVNN